jgi:hypothetical protein
MATKAFVITIIILFCLLSAAGLALKKSYQENGELEALNEQWQYANELSIKAFNNQKAENEQAQLRMMAREGQLSIINQELNDAQSEIEALRGSTDINCVNDAQWLLIENSAGYSTSSGLPDHKPSTTANN